MKSKENSIKVNNSRRARIEKMKNIFCRVFRRIDKMAATMAAVSSVRRGCSILYQKLKKKYM